MTRRARHVPSLMLLGLAGCTEPPAGVPPQRRFVAPVLEQSALLDNEYRTWSGTPGPTKQAMRIGGGALGYLQVSPAVSRIVSLREPSMSSLLFRLPPGTPLSLAHSSDIVGVTAASEAWHLVGESGRVISVNIGGLRHLITTLATRTAFSGCADKDSTVYFVDSLSPGSFSAHRVQGAVTKHDLPAEFVAQTAKRWSATRFGGSAFGPCVLWNPAARSVVAISGNRVQADVSLVEASPQFPWYQRLWFWLTRRRVPQGVLDATSFDGGIAVLFEGTSAQAGRILDFYTLDSGYLASWVLPHQPLGVAGSRGRLYSITTRSDSAFLNSYLLPAALRSAPPDSVPSVFVPKSPNALVPSDDSKRP